MINRTYIYITLVLLVNCCRQEEPELRICDGEISNIDLKEARERIIAEWRVVLTDGDKARTTFEFTPLAFRIFKNQQLEIDVDYNISIDLGSPIANQLALFDTMNGDCLYILYFKSGLDCLILIEKGTLKSYNLKRVE